MKNGDVKKGRNSKQKKLLLTKVLEELEISTESSENPIFEHVKLAKIPISTGISINSVL